MSNLALMSKGKEVQKYMEEIILYGAGRRCERICRLYSAQNSVKFLYIFDKDRNKVNKELFGIKILDIGEMKEYRNASLCITVGDENTYKEIIDELKNYYGYIPLKLISYDEIMDILYREYIFFALKKQNVDLIKSREHNIVFDCSDGLVLGGIEEWTKGLCEDLADSEEENIHILSDDGFYNLPRRIEEMTDPVIIKKQSVQDNWMNIMDYLVLNLPVILISKHPNAVLEVGGIIRKYVPDQIKIIAVIHGGDECIYRAYDHFMENVDYFVGVSEDIKEALILRGISKERIVAITCPVKCEENLKRSYTLDALQPIRIGYAGRIVTEQKRMDLMLKVIEILEEKKVNYRMEIAGDGEYRAEMENMVKHRCWKRVQFIGKLERAQIPDFWKRQDVYVNIADYEGRSISQLEAMANGAVPVVTRTSGTSEDIQDGVNGYLVEVGGYKKIADRIMDLEAHRNDLEKMGMLSHDVVFSKCGGDAHIEFWKSLIKKYKI